MNETMNTEHAKRRQSNQIDACSLLIIQRLTSQYGLLFRIILIRRPTTCSNALENDWNSLGFYTSTLPTTTLVWALSRWKHLITTKQPYNDPSKTHFCYRVAEPSTSKVGGTYALKRNNFKMTTFKLQFDFVLKLSTRPRNNSSVNVLIAYEHEYNLTRFGISNF
jgi:hypothetical protein